MHGIPHIVWGVSKHVAFGYLVYSVALHSRGRAPSGKPTGVLLFGIAIPDIVDKSLTLVGLVGYGRSFAHSLFTALVLVFLCGHLVRRLHRTDLGIAFGIGYLSHLPVDLYGPLLAGNTSIDTAFLFWPVVVEYPLGIMPPDLPVGRTTLFALVFGCALCVWMYDGMPVVSDTVRVLGSNVGGSDDATR